MSYTGEVIQVVGGEEDSYNLRANVSRGEYSWADTVFLYYSGPRLLEGDIIEFIGVVHELITYESVWGQDITIPAIEITASKVVAKAGSPAPTPNPTPTPGILSTPLPAGQSLDNPVAAGGVLHGSDGTEIVVTGVLDDATDLVMETNQFNDPPEPGNRFYMAAVTVSYVSGTDSLDVAESDYSLIGDNRIVYTPFEDSCGVIPDELDAELFPGGQTEGNICFQIESGDSNFVLIHRPGYRDENRRFLALPAATVIPMPTATPRPTPTATAIPRPTATPAPTATPRPTPTPRPPGLTLDNPLPPGSTLHGANGTTTVVTGIVEDAWAIVQAENQFNDPPDPGNRFYMATVAVSYVSGTDSLNVAEADYSLVGDNRVVYTSFENSCGVIPDELDAELFPGGRAEGNVCFQIESDDSNFVLIHEPFYSFEGERRFLSLE